MKLMYRSHFRGWVEITEEQKQKLIQNMINCITGLSGTEREKYINSRFSVVKKVV